ncbi:hypothetical protein ES332_D06G138100v1 [Gossypium tomentosum]|uniref:Uncharacterized protein n=1 Tax=Gossypium tomentosum TaxID=34277 RepID=A0A5D2KHK6_GOSTO|nr:hypothetical protein ES332_D06G138100v1 [Gossypium tomentosum]TYH66652.1 hypothetical protein ES332_D06G138100v1 [Gossypium tomentosum]TYH66653.1 hypothetical protein ES332_D06G138100v1 [Gossypium tomentosum]
MTRTSSMVDLTRIICCQVSTIHRSEEGGCTGFFRSLWGERFSKASVSSIKPSWC